MSAVTREQVYGALFALGQALTWSGGGAFLFAARRVKLWDDLPAQPALCQAEHGETFVQDTRMGQKRTFKASWLIYQNIGKSPTATPATTNNAILDAVQTLFAADEEVGLMQTLGGLVQWAKIVGEVFKDPGDLDGQGLIIVPIQILVP